MTSPTVTEWIGNAMWQGQELACHSHNLPTNHTYLDNLSRMLCPVSPIDFMDEALDLKFARHYLET